MPKQFKSVDLSYLDTIAEGDQDILKELITIFIDQIPEFTQGLENAFSEQQWLEIAAIAHKAKSSVISMGMNELGNRHLKNLELVAKELFVREVKENPKPGTTQERDAEKLTSNLKTYDIERQKWVMENASPEMVSNLITTFKNACNEAEKELKTLIL